MVTPIEERERRENPLTEEEVVSSINLEYAEKYGFADAEDYVFKAEKGLNEEVIRAEGLSSFHGTADAQLGRRPIRH
jgi:hypothetical protein